MFVCLIGIISHSLTGVGHHIYLYKKFNFSILYSSQCSVSLLRRDHRVILSATVPVLRVEILDFNFCFVNKKFLSHAFCVKELRSEYFEYL